MFPLLRICFVSLAHLSTVLFMSYAKILALPLDVNVVKTFFFSLHDLFFAFEFWSSFTLLKF